MIRNSTNDLSIRPKMSRSTFMALIVGGVFCTFVALYFAYSQGVVAGHKRFEEDKALVQQLNGTIDGLRQDLKVAEEGLIFAERQKQIQEEAYNQMSMAYANSEQKNQVLGSRLDFYRSIISPEDGQSGPSIQAVSHRYADDALAFDITLVQAIKHKHQVRGNLRVTLFENDIAVAQWPSANSRSVSYQYFQQISGSIDRPGLLENAKLKVELELQDGANLEQWVKVSTKAPTPS